MRFSRQALAVPSIALLLTTMALAQSPETPRSESNARAIIAAAASQADVQPAPSTEVAGLANLAPAFWPAQVSGQWRTHRTRILSVSSTTLNFGSVALKAVSRQTLTLTSSGTGSVTISAVTAAGTGYAVAAPALPLTLAPGQSASLQVSFDPTVAGLSTGSIAITSTANGGSTTVALSGTGSGATGTPVLSLSSTTLNFGNVVIGSPGTQSLTLTSSGTGAVTVSAFTLTGVGFTVSGATLPVTLNPGVAITVHVQFNPTIAGAATGKLTLATNSSTGSSLSIALNATGSTAVHKVTLTWAAPGTSPAPVTSYNVYRASGSTTSFQLLHGASLTNYVDQSVQSGTNYSYYVKSVDAGGNESSPSNQVAVTVP